MNRRKKLDYTPSRDVVRQRSRISRSSGSLHGGLPKSSGDISQGIKTPSVPASTTATDDLKSILMEGDKKGDNGKERSKRSLSPLMSLRINYEDATEPLFQEEDDPLGTLLDFGGSGNSRIYSSGELPLVEECDYYFMADIRSSLKDGRETFKKGSQDTDRSKTGSSHSSEVLKTLPGFGSRWLDGDDRDKSKYLAKGNSARDSRNRSPHRRDYGRHTDRSPDNSDLRNVIEEQRSSKSTTGVSHRSDDTHYDKGQRKKDDDDDDSRARDKSRSKYSRRDDKKSSSTSHILSVAAQELMDEEEKEGYKRDLHFRKDKGKGQMRYQKYDATSVSTEDKVSGYSRSRDMDKKSDMRDQRYKDFDHSSLSVEDKLDDIRSFDFQDKADERDKHHGHYDLSLPPDETRTGDSRERPGYEDKTKGYFWSESRVTDTNYASLYHDKGDLREGSFLFADQEKQRIDDKYIRDHMRLPESKGGSLFHDLDNSRAYSDAGESSNRASLPFDMSAKKEARMKKGKFLSGFELGTPFFGRLDSADKDKAFDRKYPERKAGKTESLHSDLIGHEDDYDYVYRKEDKLPSKKWSKRECIRDDNYPTLYSDKEERTSKENSSLHLVSTKSSRDKTGTGIENIGKSKDLTEIASAFGIRGRGMGRGRGRGRGGISFRGRGRGGTASVRGRGRGGTFPVRGRGEPFQGRGRGTRGKPRGAFYAGRGRAQDSHPPIRVMGKFRNTFREDKSGRDWNKDELLSNSEVKHRETKTSHRSYSNRSERSTSKDQGKDKRGPVRSSSREGREQSQKAHSEEDSTRKETVKAHEPSSKLGKADVAMKTLENKTKQSDVGMGQIREESADKNKSSGSERSSSNKARSKGKIQRSRSSSSSSSSSSCSCSVSGSSSDSGSSTSSKHRSMSSGKTAGRKQNSDQNSNQSKRIVIKLSSKDKRSVIMKDRGETELTNEKGDDDKELKKTAHGKSNKNQDSPADGASKSSTKNISSVADSKPKATFSSQVAETRQGLAPSGVAIPPSGVAIPPGKEVQQRKTGLAARRLCAMSLREQNKLVESFWSTREQQETEKPPEDTHVPAEKSESNKSEINLLYNDIFSKGASSSVHTNLQPATNDKGKETKEQLFSKLESATSDDKNTTRKAKSMADHKRTVEERPQVKRPKIYKPSSHDNREDVTVELREADLSRRKFVAIGESPVSHSKGFGIQNERGNGSSEYASNEGLKTNQHVSSHVQGNLISIIPDPDAFKQPTQQSKHIASTQGTPGHSSRWLPLECKKKDLNYQQPTPALFSEAQSYPLYSEQGVMEGEGLVKNVPAEQFYENEYYEEELVPAQERSKGAEEVAEQNEEYYYEDADYQGEGAEGVDQYTEGEWADGQCVDSFTEDEQQALNDTEGHVQGVEDYPEDYWGYEQTYQETEHAAMGKQEAQFGEEGWIDPATGYAYEDPQTYAATEGGGQEEGYYEEYQWQQEETGVTPVEGGQEYHGDGTAEWGGYGEQYEGAQYGGEQHEGEQYEGEQHEGEQYEGNQYEGNQYERNEIDVYVDEGVGEDENWDSVGIQDSATEDSEKALSRKDDELSKGDPDNESALETDVTSPEEYPKEKSPIYMYSDAEPSKPLKSILKKSKSRPGRVPVSTGAGAGAATNSRSQTASVLAEEPNDAIGQECIVKLSGERAAFYCKLCQCNFNTLTAKNLHLKGMKHIEMYIRSKSNLLNSVIAETEKAPGKREPPVDAFFLPPKFPRYR